MFVYRFFLVVNNRYVQRDILYAKVYEDRYKEGDSITTVGYWDEIFALHKMWTKYRHDIVPFAKYDLSTYEDGVGTRYKKIYEERSKGKKRPSSRAKPLDDEEQNTDG